jgi:hypothetical protein
VQYLVLQRYHNVGHLAMRTMLSFMRNVASSSAELREHTQKSTPTACHLLSLPPELREHIIRQVLQDDEGKSRHFTQEEIRGPPRRMVISLCGNARRGPQLGYRFSGPTVPALADTCHQLRDEVLRTFYADLRQCYMFHGHPMERIHGRPSPRHQWWLSSTAFKVAAPYLQHIRLGIPCLKFDKEITTAGWPAWFDIGLDTIADKLVLKCESENTDQSFCYCGIKDTVDALNAGRPVSGTVVGESKAAGAMRWLFSHDIVLEPPKYELECKICDRCGKDGVFVL